MQSQLWLSIATTCLNAQARVASDEATCVLRLAAVDAAGLRRPLIDEEWARVFRGGAPVVPQ